MELQQQMMAPTQQQLNAMALQLEVNHSVLREALQQMQTILEQLAWMKQMQPLKVQLQIG